MRVGAHLRVWGFIEPEILYRREGIVRESDPRTMSTSFFVSKDGELYSAGSRYSQKRRGAKTKDVQGLSSLATEVMRVSSGFAGTGPAWQEECRSQRGRGALGRRPGDARRGIRHAGRGQVRKG